MKDVQEVLDALPNSEFRRQIRLHRKETEYFNRKGLETILEHAADFIEKRLVPANDEKQTPWRNHSVLIAQYTTCCRGYLKKWHDIPKGCELGGTEKQHSIEIIKSRLSSNLVKNQLV